MNPGASVSNTRWSLTMLIEPLARYLIGWRGYFGFCQTPRVLSNLDAWIRRRLHMYCGAGSGGRGDGRFAQLLQSTACPVFGGAAVCGRLTHRNPCGACPVIRRSNRRCETRTSTRSAFLAWLLPRRHNPIEPPWYGPVCPVVWERRSRKAPSYPDQSRRRPSGGARLEQQG